MGRRQNACFTQGLLLNFLGKKGASTDSTSWDDVDSPVSIVSRPVSLLVGLALGRCGRVAAGSNARIARVFGEARRSRICRIGFKFGQRGHRREIPVSRVRLSKCQSPFVPQIDMLFGRGCSGSFPRWYGMRRTQDKFAGGVS